VRYREVILGLPMMLANRVHDPRLADRLVAEGSADVVGMNRALISDPAMPRKAEAGDFDDIWTCIGCNQACIGHYHLGLPIACLQNPASGREDELGDPGPAPHRLRVLVVGGGPAGMQAAAVSAQRGHQVSLWERQAELGGKIPLIVGGLPERAEFSLLLKHQVRELSKARVEVATSQEGTAEAIARAGFEAVVLAVGAEPYWPLVPGLERGQAGVLPVEQALLQPELVGHRVVVVDWRGDARAAVVALRLARDGHQVTVVSETLHPCENIHQYLRNLFTGWQLKAGVELLAQLKLVALEPGTVVARELFTGRDRRFPADTLVLSCGGEADPELYRALKGKVPALYRCGDANGARSAEDAILEAHRMALRIGAEAPV
jgi:pyruvate/2-oxoglutarate dehydrogenase complex dihydrolipoamide dehydrogenase (E3) component